MSLVALIGPADYARADVVIFKVDFSCPGQSQTKKGGEWVDFEVGQGCDGERHDPRWMDDIAGTTIDAGAGQPYGVGNIYVQSGDPICNTAFKQHYDDSSSTNIGFWLKDLDPDTTYIVYAYHAGSGNMDSVSVGGGVSSSTVVAPPSVQNVTSDDGLELFDRGRQSNRSEPGQRQSDGAGRCHAELDTRNPCSRT